MAFRSSLLEAVRKQADSGDTLVETASGEVRVARSLPARERITLAIRPEKVRLARIRPDPTLNWFPVRVIHATYVGSGTHYELRAGSQTLRAEVMNSGMASDGFAPGQEGWAHLPAEALIVLDD